MDLTTIKTKLENEEYETDEELLADVALVFTNCYTYNKDTHPVAKWVLIFKQLFKKLKTGQTHDQFENISFK